MPGASRCSFTPSGTATNAVAAAADYPGPEEVRGQAHAKRALEIAATGGHSGLVMGPPGTGKPMLAARFPGILPSMSEEEALKSAATQSLSSGGSTLPTGNGAITVRCAASGVVLVGGGSNPRPGGIPLAINGVLFLDELPEFDRKVL